MHQIRGILLTALIAGSLSGLFVSAVQSVRVGPLIYAAEVYEAADVRGEDPQALGAPLVPDVPRLGMTAVANVLVGIAFALLLVAALALDRGMVGAARGVAWGIAGFAAFSLAPAMGLPPELPGMAAVEVGARQLWWISTVAATGTGLAAIVFAHAIWLRLGALALIAAPHAIGAPHAEGAGVVPPELAAQFVAASLATTALFWVVLGASAGYLYRRWALLS